MSEVKDPNKYCPFKGNTITAQNLCITDKCALYAFGNWAFVGMVKKLNKMK